MNKNILIGVALLLLGLIAFLDYDYKVKTDKYVFKEIDMSGRDELGIKPGKSKKYYRSAFKALKYIEEKLILKGEEVPKIHADRMERVLFYQEKAKD